MTRRGQLELDAIMRDHPELDPNWVPISDRQGVVMGTWAIEGGCRVNLAGRRYWRRGGPRWDGVKGETGVRYQAVRVTRTVEVPIDIGDRDIVTTRHETVGEYGYFAPAGDQPGRLHRVSGKPWDPDVETAVSRIFGVDVVHTCAE